MVSNILLIFWLLFVANSIAGEPPIGTTDDLGNRSASFKLEVENADNTPSGATRINTGNRNLLKNPSFENRSLTSGWTLVNGSAVGTADRVAGKTAASITIAGGLLSLKQIVTLPTSFKSTPFNVGISVKSVLTDLQVCFYADGVSIRCAAVPANASARFIPFSMINGGEATSVGIEVKSTSSVAGTVIVDDAFLEFYSGSHSFNAGILYPEPSVVSNGDGTINVSNAYCATYNNPNYFSKIIVGNLAALTNQAVPSGTSFLVCKYNNGSHAYEVVTDESLINESDVTRVATLVRQGTDIHILGWNEMANGLASKINKRVIDTDMFKWKSGMTLGELGTRNIEVTAGTIWAGPVKKSVTQFLSASHTLERVVNVNGVWVYSTVTQYDNAQFNDLTDLVDGLTTLSNNKYTVNWVYRGVEADTHGYLVLSTSQYDSVAQAQLASPPSVPTDVSSHAVLVGRIIVQKNAATGVVESAFKVTFAGQSTPQHNDLLAIQGGQSGEYYHNTDREQKRVSRDSTPQPMFDNNAESGTVGAWTGFDDGSVVRPVDATGGTATGLTFTASNSSPLAGAYSYYISKDAANRQGKGYSVSSIAIEETFRGRQLQLCFPKDVTGTNDSTANNAFGVFIYDQTNNAPLSIQYGELISFGKSDHCAVFGTALNTALIRVAYFVASTTTDAAQLKVDDLATSKTLGIYAQRMSNETDLNPSTTTTFIGFGTVSGQSLKGTMTGENLGLTARFISGVSTATEARINLPYTIGGVETNKRVVGNCNKGIATSETYVLYATKGNSYLTIGIEGNGAVNAQTNANADTIASDTNEIKCSTTGAGIPIFSWSDGYTIDGIINTTPTTPLVYAINNNNEANIVGNSTDITFNEVIDVNGLWDGNEFRPDQDGIYEMCGGINFAINPNGDVLIFENAGVARSIGTARGAQTKFCGSMQMYKGRTYSLRHDGGTQNLSSTNGQFYHHLTITRKGNPSAIAIPNKVVEKWAATSGTFTAETTLTTFTTKVVSTHGAFNSANGRFTAQRAGYVDASIVVKNSAAISFASGDTIVINLKKNGVIVETQIHRVSLTPTIYQTQHRKLTVEKVPVAVGDYLEFTCTSTVAHPLSATATDNVQTFSME